MKKTISFLIVLFAITLGHAQDLKPVAKKVFNSFRESGEVSNADLFTLEAPDESRIKSLEGVVTDASVLNFDRKAASDIVARQPELLLLSIPGANGGTTDLKLVKTNIFTPDFAVTTGSTGGKAVKYDGGVHYQGIINGDNNSLAAISVFNDEVMGIISSPLIGNLVLGKIKDDVKSAHIFYNDRNLNFRPSLECATPSDNTGYTPDQLQLPSSDKGMMVNCVRLFWEVNFNIYTDKGSVSATVNYITGLFNQSAIIYTNDGLPVELSEIFVWDVTSPYTGTSSSAYLSQFQNYRNTINGDMGHLLGYGGGGGVAAGFSGFCASNLNSSQCYSGINSTYNNLPTYSWSVMVVTHEQGHLMGSRHTHACVWNGNNTAIDGCGPAAGYGYEGSCSGAPIPSGGGTVMSYCHLNAVGINLSLGFGPQPKAVIVNNYNNSACLTACLGTSCMPAASMNTSSISSTTASFNWAAAAGATGYNIRYRIVGSPAWITGTAATSPYPATGLTAGSNYEWQVQTVCASGNSIFTISMNFTTPPVTCSTPGGLSTTNVTSGSATFNWTAVGGATSYNIQYRIVGNPTWSTGTSATNSFNAFSLTPSSNYEWQVQSVCAGGTTSSFSASTNFTTLTAPCNNSQNNFTTNVTDVSATLNWSGGVGTSAISYNLRYRVVGEPNWITTSVNAPASSTGISGLTPNSNYEWQIQTVCQVSSSSFSLSVPFNTLCPVINAGITAGGPTTFCPGGSVQLNAAPTGAGYTYLWRESNIAIAGATNASYTATGSGSYDCMVMIYGCPDTSNIITVTVGGTIQAVITGNPSFCAGSNTILTANTGASTYTWYRNGVVQPGSTHVFAASSAGTYYVIETGSCGTSQSNSIVVTQINNPAPSIGYSTSLSFCAPGGVVLTSSTFAGIQYQWQKNSVDIAGATLQDYTATSNGAYRVRQTANGCYKYAPAVSTTTASGVTAAITANGPVTFCAGGSVVLSVTNAVPGYGYQWKDNSVNIPNATQSSFTATSSGDFTCTVTASCGTATSNAIVVSTGGITAAINPSGTVSICPGATAVLNANSGTGYNYQWLLDGNIIDGATGSSYNATQSGSYTVDITSPCGNASSAATIVNVSTLTATISPPGTTNICAGTAQIYTANTGFNYTYQWFRNGVAIPGATASSSSNSSYGSYTVRITQGGVCTVTSGVAVLNVINNPTPAITPQGPVTFCAGQSVVLSSNTFAGVTFQWQKNGTSIAGATLQNYTAATTGAYRVIQTANGCSKTAPAISVTVNCRLAGNTMVEDAEPVTSKLFVSPNPFHDQALLTISSAEEQFTSVDIYNIIGKKAASLKIEDSSTVLHKNNLPKGVYFARALGDKGSILIEKIVIE